MLRFALWFGFFSFTLLGQGIFAQQEQPTASPEVTTTPNQLTTPNPPSTEVTDSNVIIESPSIGQALQGTVNIIGSISVEDFQAAELTFAYSENSRDTWFLIQEIIAPISDGVMAQWDTTVITDGTYDLRLTVTRLSGDPVSIIIPSLRVRNYTPIETETPTPITPTSTVVPGITATSTATLIPPSPTPLSQNPAEVTMQDIRQSLAMGAIAALGAFLLFGLYTTLRRILH